MIEFKNVTKIYRKSHLGFVKEFRGLTDLNLVIRPGEAFGLLGLNGAGKTTTIKLLLGLLYPTRGKVVVLDEEMPSLKVLERIGYLPEVAYINKYLTGREAVSLFATLSGFSGGKARDVVEKILDKVGMTSVANKKVAEYSKGMVQRISIAQALLHDPDILVLDEPITGLDPLAIKEMRELVFWLKSQGKTVVISSHSISEAEQVCDRVGILVNGQLVKILSSEEWKNKKGWLENVFATTVSSSDVVGALGFSKETRDA